MHEALQESGLDQEASLVNRVIRESLEAAKRSKEMMRETVVEAVQDVGQELRENVEDVFKGTLGSLGEDASS